MKKQILVAVALVGLVAAGCNKKTEDQTPAANNSQNSQDSSNSQDQSAAGVGVNTQTNVKGDTGPDHFSPPGEADVMPTPEVLEIKITSSGFSPSTITIKKGDYVQFTNTDTANHWPASDPHPVHTDLSGFDAKKGLKTGENYRYQFNKTGTFTFHDHLNPSWRGSVIVQ